MSNMFFDKAAQLDEAMRATGRPMPVIDSVMDLLQEPPLRTYFFTKLRDPSWLRPLRDRGAFDNPPPVHEESNGQIRFPLWPESRYLARVASDEPETVLEIILALPDTQNIRVHEDLAEAALAMPPHLSATLVPTAQKWLVSRYQLVLPKRLGGLMARLAEGGQVDAALALAESLLSLRPKPRVPGRTTILWQPEPEARFETWSYEQIVQEALPTLVAAARERAFSLLCDILDDAVRISRRDVHTQDPTDRYEDYLHIQRPAIEDHSQNQSFGIMDTLISAVRDAADQLAGQTRTMVPRLVHILRSRQWRIFERLALYLLSRYPEVDMSLVSASLTDRRNLEEASLRHEYALLAKRGFAKLAVSDKEKVLDFIEQGPDLEEYRFRYEERNHHAPSQEQVDRHANSWQLDRLALFSDDLPEAWRRRYERLVAEFGQPEHPEFTSYMGTTWVGPTSPQSQSDLRSMSSEQITQYLADWRPSGEFRAPSADGLGRELGKLIAEAPANFAASSDQFKGLDPTYVRAYFQGLREAVQQERTFSWSPVIDLCQWVIHHPREVHRGYADNREQLQERGLDPDWGWTRKAMADLLSEGFHDNDAQVPYELRDDAWAVVRSLTEDKDPTPEDDLRAAEAGMDPVTLSINTTRGEAMHAVVRYALWVRAHEEEIATEHETLDRGFAAIPEAREVLDKHLDPVEEPSLGVRAVYGMWFPQLSSIDETWVRQRLGEIFPTDVQRRRLRDAVWEAYITVCQPYTSVFRILAGEYERAIEGLDPESNRESSRRDPDERLAEHLTVFYWAGALNLENSGGLTSRLYARSSTALRRHVLEFVGTTLSQTEEDVPPEVLQRLQRLWLYWVERALALVSPGGHVPELSAFGWWYAAKTFDDAWAIVQLKQALDLAGEIDPADLVLEHLAEVAGAFPGYAVECLRLISDSATSGFLLSASLQEVRSILDQVLHSQDREVRHRAKGLVHELGARGHWELGDLLTEATAET